MKRLIKYYNEYSSDKADFSNCSTKFEVLNIIVPNEADSFDLKFFAVLLGYDVKGQAVKNDSKNITHYIKLNTTIELKKNWSQDVEQKNQYLGFIPVFESDDIPLHEVTGQKVDGDTLYNALNESIYIAVINIDNTKMLLIDSWDCFHTLQLMGYETFNNMLESLNIESSIFDDSVFMCGECGEWHHNDDGYTYNYRIIGCDIYGLECGCAHDAMLDNLDDYINNPKLCLENDAIETLIEQGRLKKIETFIGGMVDGRGGYINGESVKDGQPDDVLKVALTERPESTFLFGRDDSGQFQTYFTLYEYVENHAQKLINE